MSEQAPERGSVRVVGTAHVSADSVEEVERAVEEERPDVVAVELDEGRYRQLRGDGPDDLDAGDLLRGNTVFQFLAYWMLSYVQARLGEEFDISPGADMLAGIDAAERLGLGVALVDRDIQVTIQRFWARLSAFEKLKLVGGLALNITDARKLGVATGLFLGALVAIVAESIAGPFLVPAVGPGLLIALADAAVVALGLGAALGAVLAVVFGVVDAEPEEVEEFDMSDLTDTDVVSAMMEEFRRFSPGGAEALIDERDAFIAHRLVSLREQGHDVVAVVGAGHREGIERYLARPETLPPMDSLVGTQSGRRFSLAKVFGYLFTLGFLVFFVLLAMAGVQDSFLLELFAAWFLVNGAFTFALAKLAGAHWTSALVGGAVAWLTSINPLLAPGWFAGYVELRYTQVNVTDIATLNEILKDEESPLRDLLARMREVPLFRLILVVAMANVGSFIGSVLFLWVLVPILFSGQGFDSAGEIVALLLDGVRNSVDLVLRGVL
ncbi:TraB/GumN family protein [Halomarina halobia]|uniref:TraB/GumN family protein n=1 Tax=Halomarina halobia TaxID=3033386 RepID=A0ABD6A5B0_9EURY|nr:TraB/GumN family protein [Halomarina sp. PSR21]